MFRRILIFSSKKSPLGQISTFFVKLGFDVEWTDQFHQITSILCQEADSLLLFVLDESLGRQQSLDLLWHSRKYCFLLSTLYVEGARNRSWAKNTILPSIVLDPTFDCDQIKIHACYLLRERLFPESLIDRFHESIVSHLNRLGHTCFNPGIPSLNLDLGSLRARTKTRPKLAQPISVHYVNSGVLIGRDAKNNGEKTSARKQGPCYGKNLFNARDLEKITEDLVSIVATEFFEHYQRLNLKQAKMRFRLPSLMIPFQVGERSEALYMTWMASWSCRDVKDREKSRKSLQSVQDPDLID